MTPDQITAFTGLGTMVGLIVVGILNRLDARKAIKVAEKAAKVSGDIHTLVNSNMGTQLRVNWNQAKRIADMTKAPSDVELANEAEKLYNEHQAKQNAVDSMSDGSI